MLRYFNYEGMKLSDLTKFYDELCPYNCLKISTNPFTTIFSRKIRFLTKISGRKNLAQKDIKKCSRIILVMTLQHACSGSLSHLKLQSSSALYRHKWARSQMILNHHILFASGISTKQTDLIQCHLLKSPRFSKLGRKSGWTPLIT